MLIPQIDMEKCDGCGLCVGVCQNNGLEMRSELAVFIGGDACTWCGLCEAVCPQDAISCPFDIILDES
ncbi:MAG: 4Fe-4S dicluster domain-containing protein [Dehalococcoidia bacterium]|nr:MAG: 4Fe-4S dicluster domain-containing protein [Dehalococcoidia bacterium]